MLQNMRGEVPSAPPADHIAKHNFAALASATIGWIAYVLLAVDDALQLTTQVSLVLRSVWACGACVMRALFDSVLSPELAGDAETMMRAAFCRLFGTCAAAVQSAIDGGMASVASFHSRVCHGNRTRDALLHQSCDAILHRLHRNSGMTLLAANSGLEVRARPTRTLEWARPDSGYSSATDSDTDISEEEEIGGAPCSFADLVFNDPNASLEYMFRAEQMDMRSRRQYGLRAHESGERV